MVISHRRLALWGVVGLALIVAPSVLRAGTIDVKLNLPVKAGLDLSGRKSLLAAPFIVVRREGKGEISFRGHQLDIQHLFQRYLEKILRRDTDLDIQDIPALDYPSYDLEVLAKNADFWRALGERTHSDLILTGSLDFDIQDKSGYRLEKYTSPFDGRTYYRQVLVEQTGFEFDILMQVYDGHDGKLLYSDNFKDFKTLEGSAADPVAGMFQNLQSVEDRIVGIFTEKSVEATRTLFRP